MPENSPPSTPPSTGAPRDRLECVDALRGLVMVVMALDHTRDFISNAAFSPTDLAQTTPAYFLTRWITHYCAPTFVFLAGVGAFLSSGRGRSRPALSRLLLTRGLWLVLLELTYVNWFGWRFSLSLHEYTGQVIWAIGCSMMALAGLIWLPRAALVAFAGAMILLHNLADGIRPESLGAFANGWRLLHVQSGLNLGAGIHFFAAYPLIPWVGVMAAGFAFGPLLLRPPPVRRRWLVLGGAGLTGLFVALRAANFYGDPEPWQPQKNFLFTVFSFVNCQKYPPSLDYLLMTLGPALLALAWLDRPLPRCLRPLLVFGRVPLFYYLLHLPLIHALALAAKAVAGVGGFGLPGVWSLWLFAVLLLYPVCRWFAEYKRTHRHAWLSYL